MRNAAPHDQLRQALLLAAATDAETHAVLEVVASRAAFHPVVHAYRLAQLAQVALDTDRLDELLLISRL